MVHRNKSRVCAFGGMELTCFDAKVGVLRCCSSSGMAGVLRGSCFAHKRCTTKKDKELRADWHADKLMLNMLDGWRGRKSGSQTWTAHSGSLAGMAVSSSGQFLYVWNDANHSVSWKVGEDSPLRGSSC